MFFPRLALKPKSRFSSPQPVAKASAEKVGAFFGFLVMMLINPPTASLPYKEDAGPLTISIRSNSEFGIPDNP
ncbi:hypothetical protein D3C80_926800 [compost metagenome]